MCLCCRVYGGVVVGSVRCVFVMCDGLMCVVLLGVMVGWVVSCFCVLWLVGRLRVVVCYGGLGGFVSLCVMMG